MKMDDQPGKPTAKSDPNDISAFKMEDYDNEESGGVGEYYGCFVIASF